MSKKIIAVNAGPRTGWNTDTLITEASRGAESEGAEVVRFDLFRLEKYTGCISCFGCKKEKNRKRQTGLTFTENQNERSVKSRGELAQDNVTILRKSVIFPRPM